MAEKTARRLGRGLTEEGVRKDLSVSAQGESNVVEAAATATSAALAAEIANTYTNVFVAEQQNKNHRYYASALRLVNRQPAEADLRHPTLAAIFGLPAGPGLSDVLIGTLPLSEATLPIELEAPPADGAKGRTLDLLAAGAMLPPNPAELIESHAMAALLAQAKLAYDLVVIDTPPPTAVSDAFPLLAKVDGVIIVGRLGRNRRDVARRLHETLTGAGAPLLGVVANGFKAGRFDSYGYGYGDSYAPAAPERPSAAGASPNGVPSAGEPAAEGPVPTSQA
jgi:Mrp family chromosome partitioning ATPase